MIILPNKIDHDKVDAAITEAAQTGAEDYQVRFGLLIEDEDLSASGRFLVGEWGQEQTPITLDSDIAGHLPRRLDGGEVKLYAEVEGVLIPQITGVKTAFFPPDDPGITNLVTHTPGAYLNSDDAIKLRSFTEYRGAPPQNVVYDILRRAPYDLSQIEIDPVSGVVLTYAGFTDSPGFRAEEKLGDVLSRVQGSVGYDFRDTQTLGHVAEIPIPLGYATRADRGERTYHSRTMPNWHKQRPTSPAFRYRYVRVAKYLESGDLAYEAIEEVPYEEAGSFPMANLPYEGQVLDIILDDASATGPAGARWRAQQKALDLARGIRSGTELILPVFDPLLQRSDRFRVEEDYTDDDGSWQILWIFRTESYKHLYGESEGGGRGSGAEEVGLAGTQIAYTAAILAEEKIEAPFVLIERIPFDLPTITPDPAFVATALGFAFNSETAVNSSSVPYAGLNSTGGWVDPAVSEGRAGHSPSAGGFYFDF